jgi:Fur family zinc uptake transcriptional regulator
MDEPPLTALLARAADLCAERGARLTPRRRRVLEIICRSDRPLGAYQVLDQLGAKAAPPTVYRALDFLLDQGLIHKLETLHAFVGCTHPEHPHASQFLICADCGDVTELEDPGVDGSLRTIARETGFRARRPVVEVIGTCADCALKP